MIYSVDFVNMAGSISHIDLSKYLVDLGWLEFNTKRKDVKIFQKEHGENFYQIDIPSNRDLADYASAMFRAVQTLSTFTGKSTEQIILELINPLSDILRVRVDDDSIDSGSIFIEDALKLFDNSKKLLAAAAQDILSPKIIHVGRPELAVQEFINNCRFGQTEIGSYVVSLVCPIGDVEKNSYYQLSLFDEKEKCASSFTRQVTTQVINSIAYVKTSIEEGNLDEKMLSDETVNISANFLEALSEISIYRENSSTEITAKWAPTIKNQNAITDHVKITHDYYSPITTLVHKIKNSVSEESEFVGRITDLGASEDPDKRLTGKIKLVYISDNGSKATATVELTKSDYDQAILAHSQGKYVKIRGALSGQKKRKIECRYFAVIE